MKEANAISVELNKKVIYTFDGPVLQSMTTRRVGDGGGGGGGGGGLSTRGTIHGGGGGGGELSMGLYGILIASFLAELKAKTIR